ncbi:hypothetical protein AGMMS49965_07330 [Bacteroidia bacterium]|nr:hypothetical protein AGMMS49965_07330 [Bacteroidia bacterium]
MDTMVLERPKAEQKMYGTYSVKTVAKPKIHYTTRERLADFYGSVVAKVASDASAMEIEWGKPEGQEVW